MSNEPIQHRRATLECYRIAQSLPQSGCVTFMCGRIRGSVGVLWVHKIQGLHRVFYPFFTHFLTKSLSSPKSAFSQLFHLNAFNLLNSCKNPIVFLSKWCSLIACHHITFFVGVQTRYLDKPKASHLTQGKIIMKYINWVSDYGILYSHNTNSILVAYCDADWIGSAYDRNSTSGGCFFLNNNLI